MNKGMSRLGRIALILGPLLISQPVRSATHKGVSLDHTEYTATARCVTTDQSFDKVSVKFKGVSVSIYFDDGGHLTLRLESEEIPDVHHIVAHVTDKGYESVTWTIDLTSCKETGSAPEEEPT